ncbi:MAG: hypothetical protein HY606_14225, partial [Planctomycetes bacterium]|nr:hypothetical protein [Planctomycetota bacterium]
IHWKISRRIYILFDRLLPYQSRRRALVAEILKTTRKRLFDSGSEYNISPSKIRKLIKSRRKLFLSKNDIKYNKVAVYVSSDGNFFYKEIFELICCGFEDIGLHVVRCSQNTGYVPCVDWHVVVAPHEFFYFGNGQIREHEIPENTIIITSDQRDTPWFETCKRYFEKVYAVWDINYQMYRFLKRKYRYVSYLPLGYSDRFVWYYNIKTLPNNKFTCFLGSSIINFSSSEREWEDRPIDIAFFCTKSDKRDLYFSMNAHFFSRYRCYFIFKDLSGGPFPAGSSSIPDTDTLNGIIQRSKILLNIHRGAEKYFEPHRIVMNGMWNKALVISEYCNDQPPFKSNRDYVSCHNSRVTEEIEFFLSPDGTRHAKKIIENAYATLTQKCCMKDAIKRSIRELYSF